MVFNLLTKLKVLRLDEPVCQLGRVFDAAHFLQLCKDGFVLVDDHLWPLLALHLFLARLCSIAEVLRDGRNENEKEKEKETREIGAREISSMQLQDKIDEIRSVAERTHGCTLPEGKIKEHNTHTHTHVRTAIRKPPRRCDRWDRQDTQGKQRFDEPLGACSEKQGS